MVFSKVAEIPLTNAPCMAVALDSLTFFVPLDFYFASAN